MHLSRGRKERQSPVPPSDRLLKWQHTDLQGRQREDYTGSDRKRPQVYARVYLSENSTGERPWFWTITDKDMGIATGYEPTADDAIEAVDRTYAGWLDSKPGELKR
jgi:hypothetical protein